MTLTTEKTNKPAFSPWVVMFFIAIPVFLGSLDLTVVSAFLPELIAELGLPFDTGLDDAAWIVTGYLLAYTVGLTFTGRLSDLLGRRAIYIVCMLLFIVGSVIVATAAYHPTEWLNSLYRRLGLRMDIGYVTLHIIVFGRVISALGAGALVPVSLALAGDMFPPERRARPLGLIGAIDTLGWVLGHLYGALVVQVVHWHWLFWINVPFILLALWGILYALRQVPERRVKGHFDLLGTVLIAGALASLSIGLGANLEMSAMAGSFEDLSALPPYAAPVLLTGALMFIAFLFVEARVRDPLVHLGMFRRRNLALAAIINLFIGYCLFIGLVSVPILVNVRQESIATLQQAALEVGILLSGLTVPMAIAAIPGGWLSDRIGIRNTVLLGLGLSLIGFGLIWQTWTLDISSAIVAAQMAVVGVGIGLTFSPISAAVINSAHDEERGVASALVIILRLVGMTISVSSLTTYGLYRVNALASAASDAATAGGAFDANAFLVVYANSTVTVLGEMGLIGVVLCGVALIPAFFLDKTAAPPPKD